MAKELSATEANKLMRALSETQREEAINASSNVIGYNRFVQKRNQVELSDNYNKPPSGDGPKVG